MAKVKAEPGLFGIVNCNRDFKVKASWGKNQFNSSFPASLGCYMASKGLKPVYLVLNKTSNISHDKIHVSNLYGMNPLSEDIYYAFERDYLPFQQMVIGRLPGIDLVTLDRETGNSLRGIEIKLTALPDNSTCTLAENEYGTELVIRPQTIVYLGLSIAGAYKNDRGDLLKVLSPICDRIKDWTSIKEVLPLIPKLTEAVDLALTKHIEKQKPLIMQPIWKTEGKAAKLHDNCLDIFVWSDFAFTRLFMDITKRNISAGVESITRPMRTTVWLAKILYEYAVNGRVDHETIIDHYTYNTKNDKAFAVSGRTTHTYMNSAELTTPRIKKDEIKKIILGGGENYLSPERRFDAVIKNTPGLFD